MSEAKSVEAVFTADSPTPPPPPPSGKPNLKVSFTAPKKVTGGEPFDVKVKVTNRASKAAASGPASARAVRSTTAKSVKTCLKVPSPLIMMRAKGATINGRTACWNRSSLGSGKSVTYAATIKPPRTASGSKSLQAMVQAADPAGEEVTTSGKAKITVKKGKAPKPKPPTG